MADFQGIFLSTPSARRATRKEDGRSRQQQISIHALREEGDRQAAPVASAQKNFYPRPPRGGRRYQFGPRKVRFAFLSTPSARRATCGRIRLHAVVEFLSTPSARRATEKDELLNFHLVISIHALREEGDFPGDPPGRERRRHFYPRPPRGGRRAHQLYLCSSYPISIHALREEGDRSGDNMDVNESEFLSTPSARRATKILDAVCRVDGISIHALREEGDRRPGEIPRYPGISIHALREEGDRRARAARAVAPLFLSTPSARRATWDGGRNHRR